MKKSKRYASLVQNVEKNKMYEVPVKIYNISKKTKSVNIKHPHGLFKVDTDGMDVS